MTLISDSNRSGESKCTEPEAGMGLLPQCYLVRMPGDAHCPQHGKAQWCLLPSSDIQCLVVPTATGACYAVMPATLFANARCLPVPIIWCQCHVRV